MAGRSPKRRSMRHFRLRRGQEGAPLTKSHARGTSDHTMKLRVLGCYGGNTPGRGMTSFLVNDTLALDAGWVSGALTLKEQVKVKDVVISHSHLDHTCSLALSHRQQLQRRRLLAPHLGDPGSDRLDEEPPLQQPHLARLHLPAQRPDSRAEARGSPARGAFPDQRAQHPRRPRLPHRSHHGLHPGRQTGSHRLLQRHRSHGPLLGGGEHGRIGCGR